MAVRKSSLGWAAAGAALVALGGDVVAQPEERVGYLSLYNIGDYIIDPVVLKWKRNGKTYSKKMGARLVSTEYICVDLSKIDNLREGDEVWLVGHIVAGDTESCRKSTPRIYEAGNGSVWYTKMEGGTLTNNRCQVADGISFAGSDYQKGNSDYCEFAVDP